MQWCPLFMFMYPYSYLIVTYFELFILCIVQDKLLNSILPKQYAEKVRKKEMYQGAFRSLHIERFEDVRLVNLLHCTNIMAPVLQLW